MGLNIQEQETSIHYMRDSDECTVYTTDSTVMTKLDKLVKSEDAPYWELVKVHKLQGGEVIGKTYKTKKKLISFRANTITRELTPEQKEAAAARMRAWREQNQKGINYEPKELGTTFETTGESDTL